MTRTHRFSLFVFPVAGRLWRLAGGGQTTSPPAAIGRLHAQAIQSHVDPPWTADISAQLPAHSRSYSLQLRHRLTQRLHMLPDPTEWSCLLHLLGYARSLKSTFCLIKSRQKETKDIFRRRHPRKSHQ